LSPEVTRYLAWAAMVIVGIVLAVIDRRWIGRPLFGVLVLTGVAAGFVITRASPFTFGGGDHFMEGVLISGGSALALAGYVLASVWRLARQHLGGSSSP
jgi:hypothetical protein